MREQLNIIAKITSNTHKLATNWLLITKWLQINYLGKLG